MSLGPTERREPHSSKEEAVSQIEGREFHRIGATMGKALLLAAASPTSIGSSIHKTALSNDQRGHARL